MWSHKPGVKIARYPIRAPATDGKGVGGLNGKSAEVDSEVEVWAWKCLRNGKAEEEVSW